jgi:hypothetical protein
MERALSQAPGAGDVSVRVVLESVVTVPTDHVELLLAALQRAGIAAWDTGQRTTTEESLEALADLRLHVPV